MDRGRIRIATVVFEQALNESQDLCLQFLGVLSHFHQLIKHHYSYFGDIHNNSLALELCNGLGMTYIYYCHEIIWNG